MKTRCSAGFTLIELMVTVALVSILMSIGLPSFKSIIDDNKLTSTANAMVSALQLAKMEAIKQHKPVFVEHIEAVEAAAATDTTPAVEAADEYWVVGLEATAKKVEADATETTLAVEAAAHTLTTLSIFNKSSGVIVTHYGLIDGFGANGITIDEDGTTTSCGVTDADIPTCGFTFKIDGVVNSRSLNVMTTGKIKVFTPDPLHPKPAT